MVSRGLRRMTCAWLAGSLLIQPLTLCRAGLLDHHEACNEPMTLQQAAAIVDCIDKELYKTGMIGIKVPDVWGQNRMTRYRSEYESQMAQNLGQFQLILQGAQRRSDTAVLTSATSLAATVAAVNQPTGGLFGGGRGTSSSSTATAPPVQQSTTVNNTPAASGSSGSAASSGPTPADPTALLTDISTKLAALQSGLLPLPQNINNFATKTGQPGVGLEPTVQLDEESNYINHLHQLRRINGGDDKTDLAGYGLYLLRMPVSLMPGPETRKGKGAIVTMDARHDLPEDLLGYIFGQVVVKDCAFALTQLINHELHRKLCQDCLGTNKTKNDPRHEVRPASYLAPNPAPQPRDLTMHSPGSPTAAGPEASTLADLRIILGSQKWPQTPLSSDGEPDLNVSGDNDRLKLLVDAVNLSQQDPYRHDPSTFSWILAALDQARVYMQRNVQSTTLFQSPKYALIGELYSRRDFKSLIREREAFLKELIRYRLKVDPLQFPSDWENHLTATDVLAFLLIVQATAVDHHLKVDMNSIAQRRGLGNGDASQYAFYDLQPTPEASAAFNLYVATKWPLHVYSLDPAVDQQNVLDAFSRRSELQLALAAAVSSGSIGFKNATSYARQLDLDLETVGLNRTAVGFGAGETTFGWMFYPRVQTPPTQSNLARIGGLLAWNGPGPNYDLKNRQIEPGQRECIALLVTPNFIPSLRMTTVANWFDIAGSHGHRKLDNQEMLGYSRKLQQARFALSQACDSQAYRPSDLTILQQRVEQISSMLPTQEFRVDLPDEGDLLGSEIFSQGAVGLNPSLLGWYGEHPKEGQNSTVFLLGRGFSVADTQVIAGGVDVPEAQKRLISRNVMEIVIPANARVYTHNCTPTTADSATPKPNPNSSPAKPCNWSVIDVHIATSNGISNHLYVETDPKDASQPSKTVTLDATTTTTTDPHRNMTQVSTHVETTPPGMALPPLTVLPLGTQWPANSTLQGTSNGAPAGSIFPGMMNTPAAPAPVPAPVLNPVAAPSASVPAIAAPTPGPTLSVAPTAVPPSPSLSLAGQPASILHASPSASLLPQPEPRTAAAAVEPAKPPVQTVLINGEQVELPALPPSDETPSSPAVSSVAAGLPSLDVPRPGNGDEQLVRTIDSQGRTFFLPPLPPPAHVEVIQPGTMANAMPAATTMPRQAVPATIFRSNPRRPSGNAPPALDAEGAVPPPRMVPKPATKTSKKPSLFGRRTSGQ